MVNFFFQIFSKKYFDQLDINKIAMDSLALGTMSMIVLSHSCWWFENNCFKKLSNID